jgi:hypothetical protein
VVDVGAIESARHVLLGESQLCTNGTQRPIEYDIYRLQIMVAKKGPRKKS